MGGELRAQRLFNWPKELGSIYRGNKNDQNDSTSSFSTNARVGFLIRRSGERNQYQVLYWLHW